MKKLLLIMGLLYNISSFALANPASIYCIKIGGKNITESLPSNDQIGICSFGKNQECEEWALFRHHCPLGGLNTQNLTKEERYCVIIGGKLQKQICTLPNKQQCNIKDLYSQDCPKYH